jgi:hypothetical protein
MKFTAALVALFIATAASAGPEMPTDWYVRAGASGDGTSADRPAGTLAQLERLSAPGDQLYVLVGDVPLDGGITLKPGQQLTGVAKDGRKPVITNTSLVRTGGVGIQLASASKISNVRIEASFASGIYGRNVTDVRIDKVDVSDANRGQAFTDFSYPSLPDAVSRPVPHGGIVLVHSEAAARVDVTASTVTEAAGFGIASLASGTADVRLSIRGTRVEGGSRIESHDIGIATMVKDPDAKTHLELSDSVIRGRLTRSGRNVSVRAASGSRADARIERVLSGAVGQDGIVGSVVQSPSEISIHISDSVIEDAGQMNVEGTLLNLPPEANALANAGRIAIEIERTVISNAGAVHGFEDVAANVWLGGSLWISGAPPAVGHYTLKITDSRIEGAGGAGLEFGNRQITAAGQTETSQFDVVLRGNTISTNGQADMKLNAPAARIDARKNCWGNAQGLAEDRIQLFAPAQRTQLDASEPQQCHK